MSRNNVEMKRAMLFFACMMVGFLPPVAAAPDDILLTGGGSWTTLPVALSSGRSGVFYVKNEPVGDFAWWASTPGVTKLSGDFDGDGAIDVALAGVAGWASVPVAFSRGSGRFEVTNHPAVEFADWAAKPGGAIVTGDFNGDRRTDLMIVGKLWLPQVMVAYSNGNGTFEVTSAWDGFIDTRVEGLSQWVKSGGIPMTGDFNGDSYSDVAVLGLNGFFSDSGTFPVAFSNGDRTFRVAGAGCFIAAGGQSCSNDMVAFTVLAAQPRVETLTGDFNGDGRVDIALLDSRHWQSFQLRVAFSTASGPSYVTNFPYPTDWAANAGTVVTGDFNGDTRTDVVLIGGAGWQSAPVLLSYGDGTFWVANEWIDGFADWAAYFGATVLAGDFDGDRRTDLALLGPDWWTTIPVAFSNGNGTFSVTNESPRWAFTADYAEFVQWANQAPDVSPLVGSTFVCGWACAPSPISLPNWLFIR